MPTTQRKSTVSVRTVERQIARQYLEGGYLRVPNLDRRKSEKRSYKMGYEVRFVVASEADARKLRSLLRKAGLKGGKPYAKAKQWVQPVYGRESMEQIEQWVRKYG